MRTVAGASVIATTAALCLSPGVALGGQQHCDLAAAKTTLFSLEQRLRGWDSAAYLAVRADLRKNCKRGDTLDLPRSEGVLVKEMCDFGKAVVPNGASIMCVVR